MTTYTGAFTGAEHDQYLGDVKDHLTPYAANMVYLTGLAGYPVDTSSNQSIAGDKTFTSLTPSKMLRLDANRKLVSSSYDEVNPSLLAYLAGNQTFAGVNQFEERIVMDDKATHPTAPAAGYSALYPKAGRLGIISNGMTGDYTVMLDMANDFTNINKFGSASHYSQFDASGHLSMTGNATVFEDLVVPLTTTKATANSPAFNETLCTYTFPKNDAGKKLWFIVQLPHKWKEGSTVYPHLHYKWSASAGTPSFVLTYGWFNPGEATAAPASIYTMNTAKTGSPDATDHWILQHSTNAGISGSGKTISSILVCTLHRTADATPDEDVEVFQLDFHYEIDSLGSNTEYTK